VPALIAPLFRFLSAAVFAPQSIVWEDDSKKQASPTTAQEKRQSSCDFNGRRIIAVLDAPQYRSSNPETCFREWQASFRMTTPA